MRDKQPSGSSAGDIKKWMESFDVETQQSAKKILQMLSEQKFSKEKLQNAAAQYGLNVQQSLKMTPKSLQQVIATAAAMTSWLAVSHKECHSYEVFEDIRAIRAFLIRIIHFVPAIQKNIAVWSFGLLHLVALLGFPSGTNTTQIWQRRLSNLGISLEMYTFPYFNTACSVYIKLPFYWTAQGTRNRTVYHQHGRFYVGSTSISASKRDFNRMAKMKQTLSDSAVHVELAIRYRANKPQDFHQFSTLVLKACTTYQDAWVFEHLLISKWQAPLNFPFITEFLKLKAKGWQLQYRKHNKQFPRVPLGDRLYQRVRRKLQNMQAPITDFSFQTTAWTVLYQLTSPGRISFETAASLGSGKFHDWEIYAIFRLAGHLEEPLRSQARHKMKQAFQFRNLTKPPQNSPLTIPFLAHQHFSTAVSRWLRDHILFYKDVAIPLHLPTAKLREAAYPTIRSMLHNHRRVEQWWNLEDVNSLPCCCRWIRQHSLCEFPDSEHLAVALEELDLPPQLAIFKSANANSTYFYSRQPYFDLFSSRVHSWTRQHGLPPFTDTEIWSFFNGQWKVHTDELRRTDRFSFQKIKHLQQWLHHSAVLHHADHEQAKLTVFCPRLYFRGAWNTWDDPQLFQRLHISLEDAQERINTALPRALQIKYKWGINKKSTLPYGFVFLKKKKQFLKGRALISYYNSRFGRLLQVTARTLDSMVLQLWPQSMGQLAVPQIWSRIHTFFRDAPTDFVLANINDDLVGFFNSVPQDRLLDAINSFIQEWKSKHGEVALSVDMSQRGNPLQLSYVGKFHKAPRKTKVIQPSDIMTIVQSSLQSHIFQAMNVIWHQIRGAGIGSHISPTISNLAVTLIERAWTQSYEETLTAPIFPFLAIRYVDNRYIIFPEEMIQDLSIQTLAQADFYQHPVELETVTTNELLGFIVDSKLRTIQYKLPEPWQIRDFASAGSLRLRLSGLQSRCHLISRYTYPRTGCPDRIHSLIHLYIAKGFQSSDCYKAIRKLNKKDTAAFCLWEFVLQFLANVPLCVSHPLFQRVF